jgi:hypothetical protein
LIYNLILSCFKYILCMISTILVGWDYGLFLKTFCVFWNGEFNRCFLGLVGLQCCSAVIYLLIFCLVVLHIWKILNFSTVTVKSFFPLFLLAVASFIFGTLSLHTYVFVVLSFWRINTSLQNVLLCVQQYICQSLMSQN